jgi:hypothetical protein
MPVNRAYDAILWHTVIGKRHETPLIEAGWNPECLGRNRLPHLKSMPHAGSNSRTVRTSLLTGTGFETNLSRTPRAQR